MIFQKKYQAAIHKISFLIFVQMLASPLVYAHNSGYNVSYKTIGTLNLSAISLGQQEELPNISEFIPHEPKKDVCLEIHELTARDKQEVIYSLFARSEESGVDSPSLVTLVKDLELLVGQGANASENVLNKIDYAVTTFGHAKLAHMLAHPIADVHTLTCRQNFIKKLVEDPALFNQVEELLQKIKAVENNFFSYWKTEKATQEFLEKRLFFKSDRFKHLNTNPMAMEISTRLGNVGTAIVILAPLLTATVCRYVEGKFVLPRNRNISCEPYTLYKAFTESCSYMASSLYPQTYTDFYRKTMLENMSGGASAEHAKDFAQVKTALKLGEAVGYGAGQTFFAILAIDTARLTNKSIRYIHTQLNGVAEMVRCCTQFEKFIQEHTDFAQGLEHKDNFKTFCDCASNCELRQFIDLLRTNTFQDENSFFSYSGRVLAAHDLMKKNKNCFAQLCLAIGEIDALMSVAKLYKNFANKRVQYTFASFVQADKPVIELHGFWHPLVDSNKVVTNDLALGDTNSGRNALVTGSNTGGKSTMLKSILITMLFAQTLTIAPAQKVVITPCTYLGCYLHVADDISAGHSLFKAEVLRAQAFLESVQTLDQNQFGFVVIDELFTGTHSEVGTEAAYKVAEKMTSMLNVVFVLATHFPELTNLEDTTKGVVKNYKVDVIKKVDGTIIRPFKLEPGISSTSIANEILRTELDSINFNV